MPPIVVMGVSGSGKSTVGSHLAREFGVAFVDADDLHPVSNKEKMRAGIPLTDEDRWPWLATVGAAIAKTDGEGGVVAACSALMRSYRDALRAVSPEIVFVHLVGDQDFIQDRMSGRVHEFMPGSLLASQFEALEAPGDDEAHIDVDLRLDLEAATELVRGRLGAKN